MRDKLSATVDVSVLDEWLTRNENYDVALQNLYTALSKVGTKITKATRAAVAAEAEARAQLPPDTRGLVVIMAEIGQGGMSRRGHRHRGGAGQADRRARGRDRRPERGTRRPRTVPDRVSRGYTVGPTQRSPSA